jgi:DNA-binding XRE family transcriptional regulator
VTESSATSHSRTPGDDDELDTFVRRAKKDPAFRRAYEDASARHGAIDSLLRAREAGGLTQAEVARRMGVKQPTVSQFETEDSDPRLSTLQRYARAVGLRVSITFEVDT